MTIENFFPLLELLAKNLGIASSKVWEWSMLEVYIQIIRDIIFLIFTSVFIFWTIRYHRWIEKNCLYNKLDYFTNNHELIIFFLIIVALMCIAISIFIIFNLPSLIINPEWHAMQNILEEISKLNKVVY